MNRQVIRIERVSPRNAVVEEPDFTSKGYRLGDPAHGKRYAQKLVTLDQAAA